MTTPGEIPYPKLTRRYVRLKALPSALRLKEANETTAGDLVDEFLQATQAFTKFETTDTFFPPSRIDEGKDPKSYADTHTLGWAVAMRDAGTIPVTGDATLNFRYIEREIIPTRTKPGRAFTGGEGKHVRVDLVLANAATGRPVVGELKIASDKDPYAGLIQALAGAAQLVSKNQRERLSGLTRAPAPGTPLSPFDGDPLIDVYVLLVNFPDRGRNRFRQLARAVKLAGEIEDSEALAAHLGRIRILAVKRDDRRVITVTTDLPKAPPA